MATSFHLLVTATQNDHHPSKLVVETPCELLRVVIDNNTRKDATIIQVDSVNKHGILLEVVQVLTDLNLVMTFSSKHYFTPCTPSLVYLNNIADGCVAQIAQIATKLETMEPRLVSKTGLGIA
ncbi:ACT domain-containing protein ACR6 [Camellia lanceoleosa]|uniref:ACT domain-containing protein ACR6 n=1 Tax=Camellia lanceoleosa TaxID=1840588 RepID=A0ACC0H8H2_9ERIC|nr:ACT domain-containing protein ACR6 [Camellia lanceoleosa]